MKDKIFDSEMKIMEMIWEHQPISAKELSLLAQEKIGWNKNTTYTVIKKLVAKNLVKRQEPNFICTALISKNQVQKQETESLITKLFNGSKKALFSALLQDENLTEQELQELKDMIEKR